MSARLWLCVVACGLWLLRAAVCLLSADAAVRVCVRSSLLSPVITPRSHHTPRTLGLHYYLGVPLTLTAGLWCGLLGPLVLLVLGVLGFKGQEGGLGLGVCGGGGVVVVAYEEGSARLGLGVHDRRLLTRNVVRTIDTSTLAHIYSAFDPFSSVVASPGAGWTVAPAFVSRCSIAAGRKPTVSSIFWPLRKSWNVGNEETPFSTESCRISSTSTLTNVTAPYFSLSLPTYGAADRQGGHQVAKKSTNTKSVSCRASFHSPSECTAMTLPPVGGMGLLFW
mmetsp:Transcript_13701/g.39997  ORF Transcript_13701/g.39997 Transcript_13701/m.39997 type:complete len:279 (-) Transcript_13701:105-941(-)